jgi:SagB-type dehydrogenase family enzyme
MVRKEEGIMSYGDDFQAKSKYDRNSLQGKALDWAHKPAPYKTYPATFEQVALESPRTEGGGDYFELLLKRRSIRNYGPDAMDLKTLSQLLWASQGISLYKEEHQFRTAPSAGALYPIETYVLVNHVHRLQQGIYHYDVPGHKLTRIREGDFGKDLTRAALGQRMVMKAPVVFVWSALVQRSKWKYEQRAYRYIYLDAGHIAQNLALAAVSLGLGSCQIGAFFDTEANEVIGLDGVEETVIYMTSVGPLK